jgi:hypothetical protein
MNNGREKGLISVRMLERVRKIEVGKGKTYT